MGRHLDGIKVYGYRTRVITVRNKGNLGLAEKRVTIRDKAPNHQRMHAQQGYRVQKGVAMGH